MVFFGNRNKNWLCKLVMICPNLNLSHTANDDLAAANMKTTFIFHLPITTTNSLAKMPDNWSAKIVMEGHHICQGEGKIFSFLYFLSHYPILVIKYICDMFSFI